MERAETSSHRHLENLFPGLFDGTVNEEDDEQFQYLDEFSLSLRVNSPQVIPLSAEGNSMEFQEEEEELAPQNSASNLPPSGFRPLFQPVFQVRVGRGVLSL